MTTKERKRKPSIKADKLNLDDLFKQYLLYETVPSLAKQVNISPSYLHVLFSRKFTSNYSKLINNPYRYLYNTYPIYREGLERMSLADILSYWAKDEHNIPDFTDDNVKDNTSWRSDKSLDFDMKYTTGTRRDFRDNIAHTEPEEDELIYCVIDWQTGEMLYDRDII